MLCFESDGIAGGELGVDGIHLKALYSAVAEGATSEWPLVVIICG